MADFYRCSHCGNVIYYMNNHGPAVSCCGEPMQKLEPNGQDGAREKHVPDVRIFQVSLYAAVGAEMHPMEPDHYIEWIVLETNVCMHLRRLEPYDDPEAVFTLMPGEKPVAVYDYCNRHGLWYIDCSDPKPLV